MIEYEKLRKSLEHLELQFENYQTLDDSLPKLIKEAVAESVIQRFETCWDCLWKILKRYLVEEIGLPDVPNGPNPILRLANENEILPTSIEDWLKYAKTRVSTSHDYSGEKAQEALLIMGAYISDAIELYKYISKMDWNRVPRT